jgi:hypothetical protein
VLNVLNVVRSAEGSVGRNSLNDVLDADRVLAQLSDEDIAAMLPHLPEGQRTPGMGSARSLSHCPSAVC